MSELKDLLDRRARQHRPADDDFTRLLDRADRRHRNRRITSGFVALAVAVAGSLGAYGMLTRNDSARTGDGAYRGIWPQTSLEEAEVAQARASRGDARFDRQVDAQVFLERFAWDGLEWVNLELPVLSDEQKVGRGPVSATVAGHPVEACSLVEGPPDDPDPWTCPPASRLEAEVTIERLLAPGPRGLWIVTAATVDGTEPSMQPSTMPPLDSPTPGDDPGPQDTTVEANPAIADFVTAFMEARVEDDNPEAREFLSDRAEAAYDEHEGGLQLYVYTDEGPAVTWEITSITVRENTDRWDVVIRITGQGGDFPDSGTIHEKFLVGSPGDGAPLQILEAERNE